VPLMLRGSPKSLAVRFLNPVSSDLIMKVSTACQRRGLRQPRRALSHLVSRANQRWVLTHGCIVRKVPGWVLAPP
jgi:hypothetical protein